jgi:hypothetical protein
MGLLERKVGIILGGRRMNRGDAQSEIATKFRLSKKEAREVLMGMKRKGLL